MRTQYYGEIKVDWTDGEWERLQRVKNGEYVPNVVAGHGNIISATLSKALKAKVIEYAIAKNVTPSELIRNVLYILTQ